MFKVFLFTIIVFNAFSQGAVQNEKALNAAKSWLVYSDRFEFKKTHEKASKEFKEKVTEAKWVEMASKVRTPLGKVISRERIALQYLKNLPGVPDGEYTVIQFKTKFEKLADSVETITPQKGTDGQWRVSGYFIKPAK